MLGERGPERVLRVRRTHFLRDQNGDLVEVVERSDGETHRRSANGDRRAWLWLQEVVRAKYGRDELTTEQFEQQMGEAVAGEERAIDAAQTVREGDQ
jgi:hypothetical protein